MSEEKDKKLKSKSALIKHKKSEEGNAATNNGVASSQEEKLDKKRVVIVKKRILKVKKDADDTDNMQNQEESVLHHKGELPHEPSETKGTKTTAEAKTPKETKQPHHVEPKGHTDAGVQLENKEPKLDEVKVHKSENAEKLDKPVLKHDPKHDIKHEPKHEKVELKIEKKLEKNQGFLGASPREPSPYERYGKKRSAPDMPDTQFKKPASTDENTEGEPKGEKREVFEKKPFNKPFVGPHPQQRRPYTEGNAPYENNNNAGAPGEGARTDTQPRNNNYNNNYNQGARRPQQGPQQGPANRQRTDYPPRRSGPGGPGQGGPGGQGGQGGPGGQNRGPGNPRFPDSRPRSFRPGERSPGADKGEGFKGNSFNNRNSNNRGPRPTGPAKGPKGAKDSSTPDTTGQEKGKIGAKKFFKAKKKPVYPKKKERDFDQDQKLLHQSRKKVVKQLNPVPKEISILESISVSELARKMNLKANQLIGKLMSMGVMVSINQPIDADTASILADEYGCKVKVVSLYDETVIEEEAHQEQDLVFRPPIVSVMGHVDHGKTKLLDAIRTTNVVATEHGGITQHIGAYTVDLPQGKIVFLDTPGHEAFTLMRARGAQVTDIVVLVVAADDGVMPQTIEAINHAKAANVPIIVAINKVDLPDANPEKVKKQLTDFGLLPEEWGGHTLFNEVSALKKTGIEELLTTILLQAEILELKADYECRAAGRVIESKIDLGRGIVATVLVERGTLKVGQSFIAGVFPGRVRAMFDDKGKKLDEAPPSIPVEILGFTGLPNAGDPFQVTESEKSARQVAVKRQELKKMEDAKNVTKITLDNLYEQIKQGEVQELKVIVKGDVHGSVEALKGSLEKLSTREVRLNVLHASAGAINYGDVLLAATYNAIIVGFHVRPTVSATTLAEREKVEIRKYSIIYDAINDIRGAMEGLLAPELKEETLGMAEVRDTFKVPKIGVIGGCYVLSGKIKRSAKARVIRDGVELFEGKISSLRRFKDDAREVETGFECGIGIENFNDLKIGDQIEAYEIKELAKKLGVDSSSNVGSKKEEGGKPS